MKIGVVGSGAIGLFYGSLLARSGLDVSFLMRSDLDLARKKGVSVKSKEFNFSIPASSLKAFGQSDQMGSQDVVILAVKATANSELESLISPLLGERTEILTLQNGLGIEERLSELFPAHSIFAGLCFVCVNRIGPAQVENMLSGSVTFAPLNAKDVERAKRIADLFARAGIATEVTDNLLLAQWKKLMWNIPFNGLSIAAGGITTDLILADSGLRQLSQRLMREVSSAASVFGAAIDPGFEKQLMDRTSRMGPYKPSSLIDFQNGYPVEVEAIWGEPLRRGKAAGAEMPRLETLYWLLRSICRPDR